MSWNMQDLLSSASKNKRSVLLDRGMTPAAGMSLRLGFEDYLVRSGQLNDRLGVRPTPEEYERIRHFFIPRLRSPKFGERIYNTEGGNGQG